MRTLRLSIAAGLLGAVGVACSAILDLESPPPAPDASAPAVDARAPDVATHISPEASSGAAGDGAGGPAICAALDATAPDDAADPETTYRPFALEDGGASAWDFFSTAMVNPRAGSFSGGAFDGRYVYLAPATNGVVARFDTTNAGAFRNASSWSVFDVATLGGMGGFSGALFDGRYVYFVPHGLGGAAGSVVARFDSTGNFGDPASWATFDTSTLGADAGRPAKGFSGAGFDGRYVYFVPNSDSVGPDGQVVRYDTSRSAQPSLPDAGRADAGDAGDAGAGDAGQGSDAEAIAATFADPSLWVTFDVSTAVTGAAGFSGAAFDGRSLYLVPLSNGGLGNNGLSGIASRFKTDAGFANPGSWSAIDLTTINGEAVGFSGAAFDGRYVYFVPHQRGVVLRLDSTSSQPTSPAAWSVFDVTRLTPADAGGAIQFSGASFDGRYVYLVPSSPGFGTIVRYDTRSTFTSDCAWSAVDLSQRNPAATFYFGAIFDGRYLYLVPRGNGLVARFDAKSPASLPNLPAFHGSFY